MLLVQSRAEKDEVATAIGTLRSELICCSRKKLEAKSVNKAILYRCIYCGIYSCDKAHCLYKNKHWKCIKEHLKSHEVENKIEFQDLFGNIVEKSYKHNKLMIHKHTQTDVEIKHTQNDVQTNVQ